jgi:hypothetical protein
MNKYKESENKIIISPLKKRAPLIPKKLGPGLLGKSKTKVFKD